MKYYFIKYKGKITQFAILYIAKLFRPRERKILEHK